MRALLLPLCLTLFSCATPPPPESGPRPQRKAVAAPAQSGWVRLPLDRETQQAFPDVWLGDARGTSIPFKVERDDLWAPQDLPLSGLVLGTDDQGCPTAEFTLKLPEGWQVREREQLRLAFELEGEAPWACRVRVARSLGQALILQDQDRPSHLFDLGHGDARSTVTIPWDATHYRVSLEPVQGRPPRITGLRVVAITAASDRPEDERPPTTLQPVAGQTGAWDLTLQAPDRVVGAVITLSPPVAPVVPRFEAIERDNQGQERARTISASGLLWHVPALKQESTHVSLDPTTTQRVRLHLPEGALPIRAQLLVRREVLIFPAEAGAQIWLHMGGRVKQAPGHLGALPDSSRALFVAAPCTLGPSEQDPHGLPHLVEADHPLKRWLPWFAGVAVLAMGWVAFRLMKPTPEESR